MSNKVEEPEEEPIDNSSSEPEDSSVLVDAVEVVRNFWRRIWDRTTTQE